MAVGIAVGYISFFSGILFISKYIRYSKRQQQLLFFLFAIAMAVIAFYAEPPMDWDLYRHLDWMDNIRHSGLSLYEFLFQNPKNIGGYSTLISFNFLRYIVCQLTTNNHWLPCICVFLVYLIIGYIMTDWYQTSGFKDKIGLLSLLLCSSFLPPLHALSGMRTALAAALMGLAVYLYIYKKKKLIVFVFLSFLAVTTHQVVLFAIPFVFLSRVKAGKKGLLLVLLASLSLNTIARWAINSDFTYLSTIAKAYIIYTSETQFRGTIYTLLADIILMAAFLILYLVFGNQFKKILWNNEQEQLYMFVMYYISFVLGNIGNYDLIVRPCYMLGVFAPILAVFVENKFVWAHMHGRVIQSLGKALCVILCLLACYAHIYPIRHAF